jgi:peptide/nickel transport system substrate-binding protein
VFLIQMSYDPAVSPNSANQDFRSAVRYGVDYKKLVAIAGPGATQAQGILATGILGSLPPSQAVTRDVSKAQGFLASSGLKNPSINLEYATDQTSSGVSLADVAQAIQASLKEVGITVNLVPEPFVIWVDRWHAGKQQMMIKPAAGNTFDPGISLNFVPGGITSTRARWPVGSDPTLDDLVNQARAAILPQQRADLFMKVEARRNDDAVFIPLFNATVVEASSKDVSNQNMNALTFLKAWEMT